MAHFAKLDDNNVVLQTVVVDNDKLIKNGTEQEGVGIQFLRNTFGWQNWKQYSYNTHGGKHYTVTVGSDEFDSEGRVNQKTQTESADQTKALRKNAAGVGYTYDVSRDAFIPPRPTSIDGSVTFNSWTLNETTCQWEPPVAMPNTQTDGVYDSYVWNESGQSWTKVTHSADGSEDTATETDQSLIVY